MFSRYAPATIIGFSSLFYFPPSSSSASNFYLFHIAQISVVFLKKRSHNYHGAISLGQFHAGLEKAILQIVSVHFRNVTMSAK